MKLRHLSSVKRAWRRAREYGSIRVNADDAPRKPSNAGAEQQQQESPRQKGDFSTMWQPMIVSLGHSPRMSSSLAMFEI
jgi:hypothetical protein